MIHRLCTDQFIRAELSDKMQQIPCVWLGIALDSTNGDFQCKKTGMMKAIPVLVMATVSATAGCASGKLGGATDRSGAVQRDYDRLTGTWQLTHGVVNGKAGFRKCVAKNNSDHRSQHVPVPKGQWRRDASGRNLHGESEHETQTSGLDRSRRTARRPTDARNLRDLGRESQAPLLGPA
jgi:hypothetical protein